MVGGRRIAGPGDRLRNRALASLIAQVRGRGPGGFYEGALARELVDAADAAGVPLTLNDLRAAIPAWREVGAASAGAATVFVDPPLDLARDPPAAPEPGARFGTALIAADRAGMVVVCALSLNAPFGAGLTAREHGFLFAASPVEEESEPVLLVERAGADRATFLVGAFGGSAPRTGAHLAHRLAGDGAIDPAAFAGRDGLAISCKLGLADPGDGCVVLGAGSEYETRRSQSSGE
jgi:hypothetical protein